MLRGLKEAGQGRTDIYTRRIPCIPMHNTSCTSSCRLKRKRDRQEGHGGSRKRGKRKILRVGEKLEAGFTSSSIMLSSRGAVSRLSRRSLNTAKRSNALFSSAAVLPRLSVPSISSYSTRSNRPSQPQSQGMFFSAFSPPEPHKHPP
jgi:hypothetical protein